MLPCCSKEGTNVRWGMVLMPKTVVLWLALSGGISLALRHPLPAAPRAGHPHLGSEQLCAW